jgi:hypothetical protein
LFDESTKELRLDPNREYYSQVQQFLNITYMLCNVQILLHSQFQLQLFVTELSFALFSVFNGNKNIKCVTVQRNEDVVAMMVA